MVVVRVTLPLTSVAYVVLPDVVNTYRTVGGRLDHTGAELRPFDEVQAREVARWFREQGVDTLGVCFLHAYADASHERRMREILAVEHPDAVVSLSSDVLREYRKAQRVLRFEKPPKR